MTEDITLKTEDQTLESLTETLERLEKDRETGETLVFSDLRSLTEDLRDKIKNQSIAHYSDQSIGEYDNISENVERLRDLETIQTGSLSEDLQVFDREIRRLGDYLEIVSERPILLYLLMTPKIQETLWIGDSEDLISPSLETLRYQTKTIRDIQTDILDNLTGYTAVLTEISDLISRDPGEIRKISSLSGVRLSETLTDNLGSISGRVRQSRTICRRLGDFISGLTEDLDLLTLSVKTETEILETRRSRIETRISLTEDIQTKDLISDMLRENTGRSFLDSGDHYGRHYERNRSRVFDREDRISIDPRYDYLDITINLYHFLTDCLEYDPVFDSLLSEIDSLYPDLRSWFAVSDQYLESLTEISEYDSEILDLSGLYGESDPFSVNTYNHESLLSQTIQYIYLTIKSESYVILQIHNGCDVRGGYTRPRVFRLSGSFDETSIFNDQSFYLSFDPEDPEKDSGSLYSDDSYHLYIDNDQVFSDQSRYTWHTYKDRDQVKTKMIQVSEKIQRLESIIEDLVTRTDSEDPHNRDLLSQMLEIRSKYVKISEDLETEYRRVSESLTINDLRIFSIEDWRDQISDPETRETLYTGDPVLIYKDSETDPAGYDIWSPGLGSLSVYGSF